MSVAGIGWELRKALARLPPPSASTLDPSPGKPVTLREHLEEVDPGKHLDWWHVGAMIEAVQGLLDGDYERLLMEAPPRTYKSRTILQGGTSCRMRNEPRSKIMVGCAAQDLVEYHSRHARQMAIDAGVQLRRDSRSVATWETTSGGVYKAITVKAGRFGFGWDFGIFDDPFTSMLQALSPAMQKQAWQIFQDEFRGRAQGRPEGGPPMLLLMHQRFASGDTSGRLRAWLEETSAESWHVLSLRGVAESKATSVPACCHRIEDPRKPGEPLCDDPEVMREILRRRELNPRIHRAYDQQDPPDDLGGGNFRASWLPIIGADRADLADPEAAIMAMAAADLLPRPVRWLRGHDYAAGGADAVASAGLCIFAPGHPSGLEYLAFDPTTAHPPAAGVESVALANAQRNGTTVEQAIPKEVGVGGTLTARMQALLHQHGFRVHLMKVGKGKMALAQPMAAAAAPTCRKCARLVVADHERDAVGAPDLCSCDDPDVRPGKLAILATPTTPGVTSRAVALQEQLHCFDGQDGKEDDLVDSLAAAFNAGAGISPEPIDWSKV